MRMNKNKNWENYYGNFEYKYKIFIHRMKIIFYIIINDKDVLILLYFIFVCAWINFIILHFACVFYIYIYIYIHVYFM